MRPISSLGHRSCRVPAWSLLCCGKHLTRYFSYVFLKKPNNCKFFFLKHLKPLNEIQRKNPLQNGLHEKCSCSVNSETRPFFLINPQVWLSGNKSCTNSVTVLIGAKQTIFISDPLPLLVLWFYIIQNVFIKSKIAVQQLEPTASLGNQVACTI